MAAKKAVNLIGQISRRTKNKTVKLLRSFYKAYQIKQVITDATRKTRNMQSVIDHFVTNWPDVTTKAGTAEIGFSDRDIYGLCKISGLKQKMTNFVITCDLWFSAAFEKAFDSINYCFLCLVLESFSFGPEFLQWVGMLFNDAESCAMNNWQSTGHFHWKKH